MCVWMKYFLSNGSISGYWISVVLGPCVWFCWPWLWKAALLFELWISGQDNLPLLSNRISKDVPRILKLGGCIYFLKPHVQNDLHSVLGWLRLLQSLGCHSCHSWIPLVVAVRYRNLPSSEAKQPSFPGFGKVAVSLVSMLKDVLEEARCDWCQFLFKIEVLKMSEVYVQWILPALR